MPFAIVGFSLGYKEVSAAINSINLLLLFLQVILCMVFARSAAMAFNRWADFNFDKENIRTQSREIPSGTIARKNALAFTMINCALFILTTFFINAICFYLSPVALLIILGYSYSKRFTPLCHLILGLGLALAPIGAYLAVTGTFNVLPIMYSFVILFWVSGFDIIYALQDEEFDRTHNLKSIPVLVGKKNALLISRLLHLCSGILIAFSGIYGKLEGWYWVGAVTFVGLLFYQHLIVKADDLSKVNQAFFTTNGIASVLFALFFVLCIYF